VLVIVAQHVRVSVRTWVLRHLLKARLHSREVERSRTLFAYVARLFLVNIWRYSLTAMAFQCVACSVGPYDKAWMLRRHERESIPCFKLLLPDQRLPIRHKCPKCAYSSWREDDLEKHRRRILRMDLVRDASRFTIRPTNTSSQAFTRVKRAATPDLQQTASSPVHRYRLPQSGMRDVRLGGSEQPIPNPSTGSRTLRTLYPIPRLQWVVPPMTQGGSGEIEGIDSHLTSPSHPPTIKRKHSDLCSLPEQCERRRKRVNLEDLNIAHEIHGTRSDDTLTVVANDSGKQSLDTDVVRDAQTDMVDQNASEPPSRASSFHPRPSRNQSASRFGPTATATNTTASHDTPPTEGSRSRLPGDESLREAHWRVWM
jgi:hypothetical protein